jgi:anti-sigma factor RsiW
MSDNYHVTELLPAYALGILDEAEAVQISEHLSDCIVCQSELDAYQNVAAQLSLTGVVSDPPPDLKRRLLDRIQTPLSTTEPRSQKPRPQWVPRLLSAWSVVSLLLILALAVGSFSMLLPQRDRNYARRSRVPHRGRGWPQWSNNCR